MAGRKNPLFQISSIKLVSFYQNLIDGLDELKSSSVHLEFKFGINPEKSIVSAFTKVDFNHEGNDFLGIVVVHHFKLKDGKFLEKCTSEILDLPSPFLHSLLNISVSGTRGYLAAINTNPPFNKFCMPLVNVKEINLDDLKRGTPPPDTQEAMKVFEEKK
jgi:hypothetical protein